MTQIAIGIVGGTLLSKLTAAGVPQAQAEEQIAQQLSQQATERVLSAEEKDSIAEMRRDDAANQRYLQDVSLRGPTPLITRFFNWLFGRA